jgi:phage terminase small subunit
MPRPTKPTSLRLLSGSKGPAPPSGVELQPLTEPPEPPEWLRHPPALAEWARIVRILVANRLLSAADTMALAH